MCSIPISSCPSWQTPEKSWKVSFKSAYIRFYMLHENNFWMQRWWNFQNPNKTDVLPLKVRWVHSPACLDLSIYPYVHTTVTVSLLNEANKTTCKKVWQDSATTEWTRLHLDILHIKLSTITNTMNYELWRISDISLTIHWVVPVLSSILPHCLFQLNRRWWTVDRTYKNHHQSSGTETNNKPGLVLRPRRKQCSYPLGKTPTHRCWNRGYKHTHCCSPPFIKGSSRVQLVYV